MRLASSVQPLLQVVLLLSFISAPLNGEPPAGTHKTSVVLTSTGTQGSYGLSATVTAFGKSNPTGTIVFTDKTTNTVIQTVTVTSNSPGGFSNLQTLMSNYNPDGAVTADVNGDGIPDLIIALANPYASAPPGAPANGNPNCGFCPGTQNIQVYLGKGDGTFGPPAYYPAGFDPNHIVIADVNGDGYPDMIVTDYDEVFGGTETPGGAYPVNEGYYEMGVYLNAGKNAPGTFQPAVYYKTGTNPWSAVVGDFNGDGFPDIIVDNSGDNTLQLFPGNGTGSFAKSSTIVATNVSFENNHSFAAGDINGDGILDLVGVNYATGNVQVLLGNGSGGKGNGTFAAPLNTPAGTGTLTAVNPVGVVLGDVNSDGNLDVVTSNRGTGNVGVLLGNGDGSFHAVMTYPIGDGGGSYANGVTLADMNGDGFQDIIVEDNGATYNTGILYGTGTGSFGTRVGVAVGINTGSGTPLVADFNGDGRPDLGTENFTPNTTSTVLGYATTTAAAINVTLPGVTTDNVIATYSGDSVYAASASTALNLQSGGLANPTVTAPAAAAAGTSFTLTVTEMLKGGAVATTYPGTLTFTSTDPLAVLPTPSTLSKGTGTFTITLFSDGPQTITVTDPVSMLSTTSAPITVSGGGLAFALASGSSSTQSASFGTTATYTFTVTPALSLFNAQVLFGVNGLPSSAYTASFSPASIAPGATGPQTVMLKINVPAVGASLRRPGSFGIGGLAGVVACFLLPFTLLKGGRSRSRLRRSLFIVLVGLAGFDLATGLSACSKTPNATEPATAFPLSVTATSGSMPTQTINITLNVSGNTAPQK